MKFFHLADLHLGRKLLGESLIEEQSYILEEIMKNVRVEKPDGIFICGDLYDKYIPSSEAVALFDSFLEALVKENCEVFIISGNHDGASRLEFASGLLKKQKVHICGTYKGKIESVERKDEYGKLTVYLLPFLRPDMLRAYEKNCPQTYHEAVKQVLKELPYNKKERNLLLTHQFVVDGQMFPETSESEIKLIGGIEAVDVSCFERFDYTALGHIHRAQKIKTEWIRYACSPLAYSFSEVNDKKGITVVELKEKGNVEISAVPLHPLRDMRKIRGSYMEVTAKSFYENGNCEDYLHVTLTDEEDILDGLQKLRVIYPNIMQLEYDNRRTRENPELTAAQAVEQKSEMELFMEFYELQNNQPMSQIQEEFVRNIIREVKE